MQWIDSNQTLREVCDVFQQEKVIAVDTEFQRTDTFYPIAALFQIASSNLCVLIDPLTIDDFSPLVALMENPQITKLFHSCSEDFEVFQHFLSVVPAPVFDTQIAAALAGIGPSLGYANLVKILLDIELPKEQTRSDWLQRPLTEAQQQYAAQDVIYLAKIYPKLLQQLSDLGRLDWLFEECEKLVVQAKKDVSLNDFVARFKSVWKLDRRQLARLVTLSEWHEKIAREVNQPRNRIVKERALYEMALLRPKTIKTLLQIQEVSHSQCRRYGETWLELLDKADSIAQEALPQRMPSPLPASIKPFVKALKALANNEAERLGLAPEWLIRKSDIEFIARSVMKKSPKLPAALTGWRESVVGEKALQLANEFAANE